MKMAEDKNPTDYCFNCNNYLGFRGFCSTKFYNEYYDNLDLMCLG